MNCLIVDDEYLAQDLLESYIKKVPGLSLVGKCSSAMEAMKFLQSGKIELMFLDIQMPDLTGIELLRTLRQRPKVIMTTAYSDYAVEGYSLDVSDYLLKPISFERFLQAVTRIWDHPVLPSVQLPETVKTPEKDHLFVKSDHKLVRIRFSEIVYVEGLREYISIYLVDKRVITLESMKNMEEQLPASDFVRIHKSYIVAIKHIEALVGATVEVKKKLLPIGKTYRQAVLERFK